MEASNAPLLPVMILEAELHTPLVLSLGGWGGGGTLGLGRGLGTGRGRDKEEEWVESCGGVSGGVGLLGGDGSGSAAFCGGWGGG